MAVYRNNKQESPITSVEFSPVSDGNFTFFFIDSPISVKGVKEWLQDKKVSQEIIAETQVSGHPVLVTHGDKPPEHILAALKDRGEELTPYHRKKAFSEQVWPMGASIATVGQLMQLTSSYLRPKRDADWTLRLFAGSNLLASAWIFFYGAQRSKDPHRLTYLKRHFNEELGSHAPGGQDSLPDINDTRLRFHNESSEPKNIAGKMDDFLARNSVTVGEIGLRYLGATSLAFSSKNWGKAFNKLLEGEFKEAYKVGRTATPIPGTNKVSLLTHNAGMLSLTGKTIAIASKAEDPYNPKPSTWLDKVREKFTFNFGGALETIAFATVAYDGFKNKKISFKPAYKKVMEGEKEVLKRIEGVKEHADVISGIGSSLFTIRYIMRNWAPFGVREMDMPELYAHVTDCLAKMPPDKLPQLLADTAADITDHFQDKHLKYGEVFSQLLTDLYRYHHIALDNLGTEPEERLQKNHSPQHTNEASMTFTAKQAEHTAKPNKKQDSTHTASHVKKLTKDDPAPPEIGR